MQKFFGVLGVLLCLAALSIHPADAQGGDAVISGAVKPGEILDVSGAPFFEACPMGDAIRVIQSDGSVICESVGGGATNELDERYINAAGDEMLGVLAFGPNNDIEETLDGLSIVSDGTLQLEGLGTVVNAGMSPLELNGNGVDVNTSTADFNVTAVSVNIESQGISMSTLGGGVFVDGTLVHSSDRELKSLLREVDGSRVLGALADLPLYLWRWKDRPDGPVHIGPTAQGFAAAFETGDDDRYIASLDAQGVALAAIQELHERLEHKDRELTRLRDRQERTEAQLEELRALVAAGR